MYLIFNQSNMIQYGLIMDITLKSVVCPNVVMRWQTCIDDNTMART